jgi:hypothetical protein
MSEDGNRVVFAPAVSEPFRIDGRWQPIDSAKRDGTWILVFEPAPYPPNFYVVQWGHSPSEAGKETWLTAATGGPSTIYEADAAIYWKPLDPPTDEQLSAAERAYFDERAADPASGVTAVGDGRYLFNQPKA